MRILKEQNPYNELESKTTTLLNPIRELIQRKEYPVSISQFGSMWTLFFRKNLPTNFLEVKEADSKKYSKLFWQLLESGIYLVPSQFETNFVSVAHTEKDLKEASEKICNSLISIFDGAAQ